MWRLLLATVLLLGLAQRVSAQSVDWPALLKDAEQAARQVSDEKERRALLVDIAVAYIAGKIDGADRLIEETRAADGKCAEAIATAYSFMDGANPLICRANGPVTMLTLQLMAQPTEPIVTLELFLALERSDYAGAFSGFAAFPARHKRMEFMSFIAHWLSAHDRRDGIAAIANLPTDNLTKDDFLRLVAWHAGRFAKFEIAHQAISMIQSKPERFAANIDLATQFLVMGSQSESHDILQRAMAEAAPEERMAIYLGSKSMGERGQFVGWFDGYAPRPYMDSVGVTPRFGPVTFLALGQFGTGDWKGLRLTLAFLDEIVAQASLDVEDYNWQLTICYLVLGHLMAGDNDGADRTVAQLRRWIDTNTFEHLRNERRGMVDWVDAWEIARRRLESKENFVGTLELIASVPQIVRTAIVIRAFNTNRRATFIDLKSMSREGLNSAGVLDALVFHRSGGASLSELVAFVLEVTGKIDLRGLYALDRVLLHASDGGHFDRLDLAPAEREKFLSIYRRDLAVILVRAGEIDAARSVVQRCVEQPVASRECRTGREFLIATLMARRFDLATVELPAFADPLARGRAILHVLRADWRRQYPAVVFGG